MAHVFSSSTKSQKCWQQLSICRFKKAAPHSGVPEPLGVNAKNFAPFVSKEIKIMIPLNTINRALPVLQRPAMLDEELQAYSL
jgi:hypothetical protein